MSDSQTPVVVTPKPWWESKTNWFNMLLMLLGLGLYFIEGIQRGELQAPWVIDEATLSFWAGLIGFILRSQTNRPVTRS